jgi:hypothetical protein
MSRLAEWRKLLIELKKLKQQLDSGGVAPEFGSDEYKTLVDKVMDETDVAINGPLGYSKLILLLSANIQGMLLAGDPPNVYELILHDVKTVLNTAWAGLGRSLGATVALNAFWKKKYNIGNSSAVGMAWDVGTDILTILSGSMKSFRDLDASLFDNAKVAGELTALLKESDGEITPEIENIVQNINRTPFLISPRSVLKAFQEQDYPLLKHFRTDSERVQEMYDQLLSGELPEEIREMIGANSEYLLGKDRRLLKTLIAEGRSRNIVKLVDLLEHAADPTRTIEDYADVDPGFEEFAESYNESEEVKGIQRDIAESKSDEEASSHMRRLLDVASVGMPAYSLCP